MSYAPHLYDPQPRHERTPERIPTFRATRVVEPEDPERIQAILGAWLVAFPLALAALGVIM